MRRAPQGSKAEAMIEYLQKSGLEAQTRVFVLDSPDDHVRQDLLRRGWKENPARTSQFFDLRWAVTDTDEDYKGLGPGDLFNHFENNRELTQKAGMLKNLQNHAMYQRQLEGMKPKRKWTKRKKKP